MTTPRKRKSPNRKKQVPEPGILSRLFSAAGRTATRHPRLLGGVSCFAVVFGFIAANALWYQPGTHPSPFLATRDSQDPNGIAGYRPARNVSPQEVTTFRIERQGAGGVAATEQPSATSQSQAVPQAIVAEVQRQLVRRGLYQGTADGLMGPQTKAAILFFQETEGMAQTGEATPELVAALSAAERPATVQPANAPVEPRPVDPRPVETVAVPAMRPPEDVSAAIEDPVAAAIRASGNTGRPATNATRAATPPRDVSSGIVPSTDLVFQIQRGLSNIAYTDITVDGVAGNQTKAAIRRFEKHYRLPETGLPNEMVLKKLKSIGAL
ncbi:peptidoglycan-binding protein [Neorhizobium sp. T786]|uniref:peptidoglycan-binding domain-containing protein n=1 Tax=Pseudorhizobium xiangyangii TaxID=2883104 RepID=UPI001CFFF4E7|nr:peptidoglycan-binding domain-containing protein [Neorhizobium xiangyangii]MCB5202775.1 peptidoglycan-binding protein [Neorhizobium xiangyangii]